MRRWICPRIPLGATTVPGAFGREQAADAELAGEPVRRARPGSHDARVSRATLPLVLDARLPYGSGCATVGPTASSRKRAGEALVPRRGERGYPAWHD